ncbi:MULE transposase [Hirsutella rhossiliensis]|uniref:MULE transposase domain-containing protein n=1 Tax=Hirsutella rhossiliensis TaxID=111463 RepID=A0A9P8MNL9_9HYPO|nr:MULE transposase domain-containing protein [Hirsutella rhossiliensis]KAH0957704.1 MULE transposase domain-containing protein [Hirsutella rhossiliensis]
MPLLQIIGTTGLHKSYSVAFGIASKEDEGAFNWILSHLYDTGRRASIPAPGVVITGFDKALKNALSSVFPFTQQQLCVWHMMKNVILHIKKKWVGSLEDTRLGAAAALANDRTNANAIEDRPIDHTAEAQIQHASQLADQYLDEEQDDEGNPIPPPPPKRTFKHTADVPGAAHANISTASSPIEAIPGPGGLIHPAARLVEEHPYRLPSVEIFALQRREWVMGARLGYRNCEIVMH